MPTRASALLAVIALLAASGTSRAQSISIDTVPPYAVLGFVTGTVTGVDPSRHHVAVYIQIEGAGWWTKPTSAAPTVPIDPGGGFSANVGTGGAGSLDSRATIFCVALLPDSVTPPLALGAGRMPASLAPLALDCRERYGRTVSFAGYTWAVKESHGPVGPGPNLFSDRVSDVYVDADGLHLRVDFHDGQWWSAEVILLSHLGHGSYAVQTESELDLLDANATFGIFTWDAYGDDTTVPGAANREIDFEDSRWGDPADPTQAQMVVQPYGAPDHLRRYTLPDLSADPALTRFFSWWPDGIAFTALTGHHGPEAFLPSDVIDQWLYTHAPPQRHVPPAGRERLRLNLWLNGPGGGGVTPPAGGQPVEVVISDFRYVPEPGTTRLLGAGLIGLIGLSRRRSRR